MTINKCTKIFGFLNNILDSLFLSSKVLRSIVEEPTTYVEAEADDHVHGNTASEIHHKVEINEDLAESEENIQKMKMKIHAMQKANWRLRKQKETLRSQLDNAVRKDYILYKFILL